IPLMIVGARLATDFASAVRVLRVALIAGIPVLIIGLGEALALAEGKAAVLYRLYGDSAQAAFTTGDSTVQGARVSLRNLHRAPSGSLLYRSSSRGGDILGHGFRVARSVTWLGLGPGTDTNAARAVAGSGLFDAIGGRWQESYLVKSWIELGVPGLLLVVWMLVALLRAVTRRAAGTGSGRTLIAASSGPLVAALATSIKGAILDQAPANAYFWLFAGLAIGARSWAVQEAPLLDRAAHGEPVMSLRPAGVGLSVIHAER